MEFNDPKEMYKYFLGSKFHMDREGAYEKYKSFNVNEKDESDWRKELVQEKLSELPDRAALSDLSTMDAYEAIPELMKYLEYGDGFFQCRLAETLFDLFYSGLITSNGNVDKELLKQTKKTAFDIWKKLTKNPNQEKSFILYNEVVNNNYLMHRAKSNIQRCQELLKSIWL